MTKLVIYYKKKLYRYTCPLSKTSKNVYDRPKNVPEKARIFLLKDLLTNNIYTEESYNKLALWVYNTVGGKSSEEKKSDKSCKKINIILDIDETLIYFIQTKLRPHSWDLLPETEKQKYNIVETKNGQIIVIRPGLDAFLDYLFKHFNVSLWTLSEREYAEDIAAKFVLKPGRKLKYIFSADDSDTHSVSPRKLHRNNKDLNWLWYDFNKEHQRIGYSDKYKCFAECNTILIDDLYNNALNSSNWKNSIKIDPFALFGEDKQRRQPYVDVSTDDTFVRLHELLEKVRKSYTKCYNTDTQWDNIFSDENIERYGLQSYVKKIKTKSKKREVHVISLEKH